MDIGALVIEDKVVHPAWPLSRLCPFLFLTMYSNGTDKVRRFFISTSVLYQSLVTPSFVHLVEYHVIRTKVYLRNSAQAYRVCRLGKYSYGYRKRFICIFPNDTPCT